MDFQEYYFSDDNKELFLNYVKEEMQEIQILAEDEVNSVVIPPDFISRLLNHLEKCFPNYGQFDQQVGNEIRKFSVGDNSYIKKLKKRIHEIIIKAKHKYLTTIGARVEKIKIIPKNKPQSSPVHGDPLLASDEPISGDVSNGIN